MKKTLVLCFALLLLATAACTAGPGKSNAHQVHSLNPPMSVEELTVEAETKYAQYLNAQGGDRRAATEQTAAYLETRPGIQEVTIRGSDSLMVLFTDGNELLLMLGTHRL